MIMRFIFGLFLLILAYVASISPPSRYVHVHVRPGRHVCLLETIKSRPIPTTKLYKKTVYTPRRRNCQASVSCPQYDVTYVTATKRVLHVQRSGSFSQDCCPGWTIRHKRDKGCMEPICESGCGESGVCVQPGVCQCPTGFHGENCDIDIDECLSRDHGCHHFCTNTAGSYLCVCKDGFALAEDGTTCTYCFTCSKEYISMQTQLHKMQQELKVSKVLCRSANFETSKLKYRVSRMATQVEQLEQGLYNNTQKVVDPQDGSVEMAVQLNKTSGNAASDSLPTTEPITSMSTSNMQTSSASSERPDDTVPTTKELSSGDPNETLSPKPVATAKAFTTESSPLKSSKFPELSKETSSTSPAQIDTQAMPVFLYERFASLSQQIGLLEERIGMCACSESGVWPRPRE